MTQLFDDDDDDHCCVHMISVHCFCCACIKKFKVLEVEVACFVLFLVALAKNDLCVRSLYSKSCSRT